MADVLVLYYSRKGATESLAREVCKGVDSVDGMSPPPPRRSDGAEDGERLCQLLHRALGRALPSIHV